MLNKLSIKGLFGLILTALFGIVLLLLIYTVINMRDVTVSLQRDTLAKVTAVAVKQVMEDMRQLLIDDMGVTTQSQLKNHFNQFIKNKADAQIKENLIAELDDLFEQRAVTAGYLDVRKIKLYDTNLKFLLASKQGISEFEQNLPQVIYEKAINREGPDRLKALSEGWISEQHGAMFSVLLPLGGLSLKGYVEIEVDPTHNLKQLTQSTALPLTMLHPGNTTPVFVSENWNNDADETISNVYYTLDFDGKPAIKFIQQVDISSLSKQLQDILYTNLFLLLVVIIGLFLICRIILNRSLLNPISSMIDSMAACARGDLTMSVAKHSSLKDLGKLSAGLSVLTLYLQEQVKAVLKTSKQVSAASMELNQASVRKQQTAGEQIDKSEEVTAAVKQMSLAVQEVAESAGNAADYTKEVNRITEDGRAVVQESIQSIDYLATEVQSAGEVIGRVKQDTESVGDVLGVIRSIAEQTNLLALNAAIEAARAGEQGRGFAVVADEVRSLAGRTQESIVEIEQTINTLQDGADRAVSVMQKSQEQAQDSMQRAQEAIIALDKIAEAVGNIVRMTDQIATASEEQGVMAGQIDKNIDGISELSSVATSSTSEIVASSEKLQDLAVELQFMVDHFKLPENKSSG